MRRAKFLFDVSPSFVNIFTPFFDGRVARDALSTPVKFQRKKFEMTILQQAKNWIISRP
jgi:hypothetical protein